MHFCRKEVVIISISIQQRRRPGCHGLAVTTDDIGDARCLSTKKGSCLLSGSNYRQFTQSNFDDSLTQSYIYQGVINISLDTKLLLGYNDFTRYYLLGPCPSRGALVNGFEAL